MLTSYTTTSNNIAYNPHPLQHTRTHTDISHSPATAFTCSVLISMLESLAFFMAAVARGQPDRLRCDRKLPAACPDPSQPGVGHLDVTNENMHKLNKNFLMIYLMSGIFIRCRANNRNTQERKMATNVLSRNNSFLSSSLFFTI